MDGSLDSSLALSLLDVLLTRRDMTFAYLDSTLHIRSAGPRLAAFIEGEPGALVGSYLPDVFVEFVGLEDVLGAVVGGEAPEIYLMPVARETREGQVRYLSFQVLHLKDNPQTPGLLLIEDITNTGKLEQHLVQERNEMRLLRAELERANAKLRHLNQFKSAVLSMAAHDLRSPLSALVMQLDILLDDVQTGRQTIPWPEMLEWMQSTAGRMGNLIAGLLDREQAEQGKLVLHFAMCDLVALIRRVVRLMSPQSVHRIELEAPAKEFELIADAERLQQVFYNLIENALKYAFPDQPITVTIRRQDEWAVVDVCDRGNGMTPEQVAQLFQMYYRTEKARQSGVVGAGLGLVIAKTLVEAHGGRLEVQSVLDQGTTVRVYLPIQRPLDG